MRGIKFTDAERLILINQLEIRKALAKKGDPPEDFDRQIEILENGYEVFYNEVGGRLYEPMPEADSVFVMDVLTMFMAIELYKKANPDDAEMQEKHFLGFDGNNETQSWSFVRFLVLTRREFTEMAPFEKETDGFNSHWTLIPKYREQVARWKALGLESQYKLTRDTIRQVLGDD